METKQKKRGIGALNRIVENDFIHRVSADEYREKVKDVYGGKQGHYWRRPVISPCMCRWADGCFALASLTCTG